MTTLPAQFILFCQYSPYSLVSVNHFNIILATFKELLVTAEIFSVRGTPDTDSRKLLPLQNGISKAAAAVVIFMKPIPLSF